MAIQEFSWETDAAGRYVYVCERVSDVLGFAPASLLGLPMIDLVPSSHADAFEAAVWRPMRERQALVEFEHPARRVGRNLSWLRMRGAPCMDPNGNFSGYRGFAVDITGRNRIERQLETLACRDDLWGTKRCPGLSVRSVIEGLIEAYGSFGNGSEAWPNA